MKSCINCSSRQFDTQWITCECMNATGSWFISSLDLSEFFFYVVLACHLLRRHRAVANGRCADDGIRYNQQWHVLACYDTRGALDD